jgi:hypothetical protein
MEIQLLKKPETGYRNIITEETTVTQIIDAIQKEFDVEPERCKSDVMTFIKELSKEDRRLLTTSFF